MKDALDNLQSAFLQLSVRERIMVSVAAAFVVISLMYLLIWQPMSRQTAFNASALERARATASQIERAAAQLRGAGNAANVNRSTSLLTAVDQTSRSATLGKAPSRVQPEGDREVKIWIEDVPFNNVLRWLQELETRFAIHADSAEIERGSNAGLVNVRLSLVR